MCKTRQDKKGSLDEVSNKVGGSMKITKNGVKNQSQEDSGIIVFGCMIGIALIILVAAFI